MWRKAGVIVLLISTLLSFVSCAKREEKASQQAQVVKEPTLEKIKVAQFAEFFLYMPLYLAEGKGFFKANGLSIDIVSTGGDDKTFAAVISGEVQFGIADPTFVAIAKSKGQPGKVVAGIVNGVPFWGVTKNPKVPEIKDAKQLKGFTVVTFPSPSTAFTLQTQMFKSAGLKPKIRQAGFGALLPLLDTKDADIALELEPNVSTAVKGGARVVYSMAEIYGDFAITGVTTSEELMAKKPDLVQKFVNAIEQAHNYAHTYPDSAVAFAVKRFPAIDPVVAEQALKRVIASNTLPSHAKISKDAWRKACQLRVDVGDLQSMDAAWASLDTTFAQRAMEQKVASVK
jgi:NitT/TauT family transport system substrate-binding protein